jgi:cobalt/nickel transport system permease protein
MAHIPDGVLSLPVLVAGAAVAAAGLGVALRRLDERDIPKVGLMSAAFFVSSLVAVPLGPTSVHLLLGGVMGLVLGVQIFPAVFVGLLLQAAFFGMGGLTTLGVDTANMALPGLAAALAVRPLLARLPGLAPVLAGAAGVVATLGTGGGVALALAASHSAYVPGAAVAAATYLPLAAVEGLAAAAVVGFLLRVRPDVLAGGEAA